MMRRSRLWVGAGIFVVLILALGLVFRVPLLDAGLRTALDARGFSGVAMRVEHLGWSRLEIRDLDYSGDFELQARSIRIGYQPLDLLTGRLNTIEVDGVRLRLDLTEGMPSFSGTGGGGAPPLTMLPSVQLTDAHIELLTNAGEIVGPIDARLEPDQDGALRGTLAFQLEGAGGRITGNAEGRLTADRRVIGAFDIKDGEIALPGPAGGFVLRGLSGHGKADWTANGAQEISIALSMPEATLAGVRFGDAKADVSMRGAQPNTAATLFLSAAQVAHGNLSFRDLQIDQGIDIQFKDKEIALTSLDNGIISVTDIRFGKVLTVHDPLLLHLQIKSEPLILVTKPFEPDMTARFDFFAQADPVRMTFKDGTSKGRLLNVSQSDLSVTGSYEPGEALEVETSLDASTIVLPVENFSAHAVHAEATLPPGQNPALRYTIGTLTHDASPPLFAPLSVSGRAELAARTVNFSTEVTGADASVRVKATGKHSLETGQGRANLQLTPLDYRPGGAQPGTLLPSLADLKEVSGHIEAQSALTWTAKGLGGTARVQVSNLSFQTALAQVEGLSLDLDLDQVFPPASPPGQSLRIGRIDPGVPIEDLSLNFQMLPSDTPSLSLDQGAFRLAGGVFRLTQVTLDAARDRQELPFQVQDLDLSEIFALLGVEGLSGTGRLDGPLPVQIVAGRPKFTGGRLAADAPGRLEVRSERVRQALGAAGESAGLLLRALEDFRYQELSLTIDQPSKETAILGLSMLGHNPAVLDGYPFRININLETNPEKLLGALQEAYSVSGRAMRQLWMFGR